MVPFSFDKTQSLCYITHMAINVKHWEWKSAQECLEHLLEKHNHIHIFVGTKNVIGIGNGVGSYKIVNKKMLEGRIYTSHFCDNSVGIDFHDVVFINWIKNRSYPEQVRCVMAPLPFI